MMRPFLTQPPLINSLHLCRQIDLVLVPYSDLINHTKMKEDQMTIANWCVLAACVLPVLTVGLAKAGSARLARKAGGYDNNNPRVWEQGLTGWRQRANAAQNNGFEALPLFIAAVILAQQSHADQGRIDSLALAFIALRVLYVAAYLMNQGTVRSLLWAGGVAASIAILVMA